jgi:hypothetical protein
MMACAENETTNKEKYGPRALYREVLEKMGISRFVVIAPAPPRSIPRRRYRN